MSEVYRTKSGKVITDVMIEKWAAEAECGYALDGHGRQITLVRAVQTCFACPSQWDAWDADGAQYYLRYRHGVGSVCRLDGKYLSYLVEVARFSCGDPLDGSISLEDFARLAGIRLELS